MASPSIPSRSCGSSGPDRVRRRRTPFFRLLPTCRHGRPRHHACSLASIPFRGAFSSRCGRGCRAVGFSFVINAQAMRAVLLASETATLSRGLRASRLRTQAFSLTSFDRSSAACAPMMGKRRIYRRGDQGKAERAVKRLLLRRPQYPQNIALARKVAMLPSIVWLREALDADIDCNSRPGEGLMGQLCCAQALGC